jgi:hypothetical protein
MRLIQSLRMKLPTFLSTTVSILDASKASGPYIHMFWLVNEKNEVIRSLTCLDVGQLLRK